MTDTFEPRRAGNVSIVTGVVAYLVSNDAAWVTGQILTPAGGLLSAGGQS